MSAVDITVQKQSISPEIPGDSEIKRWVNAAVSNDPQPRAMCVRIVDEPEARSLNRKYRGRDQPTNVLSFSGDSMPGLPLAPLGDVVVCAPVVAREAAEQRKPLMSHWAHVIVHGVLHLQGYDHDNDREARKMEQLEIGILRELGYADPYAPVT